MNLLNSSNRKTLGFSISIFIFNIILFIMLILFPTPFIKSIKISMLVIITLLALFLTIKKHISFIYTSTDNRYLSQKQGFYKQNIDIMNKFLKLKDLEVHNLEAEILIKDQLYKQLFDFAPDAFVIFNIDHIIYSNDAFTKLLGFSVDADFSCKEILNIIHPDSVNVAKEAYNNLLSKVTDVTTINIKIISSNNIIKKIRISSSITFFEDAYYIFSCLHDLSTHYEQERIKTELENNVACEKFKVEFFANISHDLKTPINVIYSAVQLQEMYTQSNDYDKILVYNNTIKQNCLRLQKLLNDVLDITKIDANHFKPKLELHNIIGSIEYLTQSITSYFEQNEITIIFDTNVEDKFVMTDFSFIERILLNLISNAIKYGSANGNVWLTLHDEGNHLIISVKDDGIGIPKGQVSKIFNRFHTTNQNACDTAGSNGIGLSLVKSMVDVLNGTIFCLSTEGVGSEFVLILPMKSQDVDDDLYCEYATSLDLGNQLNVELSDI